MGRKCPIVATLIALGLCSGCFTVRHYPPPNLPPSSRLVSIEPTSDRPPLAPITQTSAATLPRTVLAISGGGLYGAFSSGVLKGWSDSGTRPTFDAVTGISTGALIAPLAFLGEENDDILRDWYTTIKPGDVYRRRPLPSILWSDSVADSKPLRQKIDSVVTAEFLERIAKAHAAGRRLYIGTTDLDTKRLVVWDLGAVAASNDPNKLNLFRKVLLASCAIPGVLPPVAIDIDVNGRRRTELHVDGGVSASVFVPPVALGISESGAAPAFAGNTMVYVIVSGKIMADSRPVPQRVLDVSAESLNGLLRAQTRADLMGISLLAHRAGAKFGYAAVPNEFAQAENSIELTPKMMGKLFEEGYRFSRGGPQWQRTPPGLDADSQPPPRTGTHFTLSDGRPLPTDPIPLGRGTK